MIVRARDFDFRKGEKLLNGNKAPFYKEPHMIYTVKFENYRSELFIRQKIYTIETKCQISPTIKILLWLSRMNQMRRLELQQPFIVISQPAFSGN